MSIQMKPIQMYECQHCKKLFRTSARHNCRKDPDKTNCYTCEHWGHQFYFDKSWNHDDDMTCSEEEACKMHETSWFDSAYEIMRGTGWHLDCPNYRAKA
jgi:hypothetical protein